MTGETGEAKSSFTVNVSPVYGKCTVSPDTGVALETDFRVHCTDWREFQVLSSYQKNSDTRKITAIILTFEQCGFTMQ